jgi:thimet oligopeptidase
LPGAYHPQAAWGHLTGYSACYYTYVWSLVIARDLLTPFRTKGNLTDPELARRYAREILAPGGSRPADESIRAFLGRDFDLKAFTEWVHAGDPTMERVAPPGR